MVVRRLQSKRQDIKNESLKTSLNNNTGAAIKYYMIKKQINDRINVYYGIKERAIQRPWSPRDRISSEV